MSGVTPFFVTGASAKIRLNDKTLAFCTDVSYSVQINTATPKVLGMYEGSSVEVLGYQVSGTFSVVRYAKDIATTLKEIDPSFVIPKDVAANDAGNGVGNWGAVWGGKFGDFLSRNGIGNDGRANEAMDPSKFQNATTFDIQIYQKVGQQNLGVANIRNARITASNFQLRKRGPAIQTFSFVALYVDEDSFRAEFSGLGQQFS
jgi:hypothetical protein